ncbi:DUF1281 family ferredoxin-like fold protein [Vagococcus fessus]|uniref:YubB ferredoxin-like domain-containing protein n=1 Tax=Vagococcus fessus TaxID=120370 RepID=A0A430A582_9ENTE|nr:hypothetical protein [Vagococcus fessus]RSU01936.1 hypothetical protein CBF31_09210 [Vagococcus fessus]
MPNHITNKLTINGTKEQVKRVLNYIKGPEDGQYIDFRKIATPPNYIYMGSIDNTIRKIFRKESSEAFLMQTQDTWSEWCVRHWGTKWNAYSLNDLIERNTENIIYFQTAWSGVPKIILLLAQAFPEVSFKYEYADEDFGYNTGVLEIKSITAPFGQHVELSFLEHNNSKKSFLIASELIGAKQGDFEYKWDEAQGEIVCIELE